ncbi:sodium/proton antiporter, CPA1 family [Halobacillus karajensis]|uniref:Sodium, potassium, lithium and rubidium/H(+) antiporter n=1 Tax=Halobacillus karajensis TaxID=195088 RepID=A0A024P2G5_9BACI|nr:sodium:proton antiporter [Halobacillus karajensis]CDQ19989.1 Sodium, potassium, lithium and rubidium/H(+) antiporter [Halobacillus karajensis]CDQ22449.1 Sodium, potassium, lithium and rubidium/H(+) antiporter [Halobacillus karajensis]CDQ28292.1 Sodium, potassium, lithium and rubidium/H(+) antiporter [Halobacillus karajensis]SEH68597.1 sodium/proton antiporter, CPA1 family [Halobacillus karajensis]
MHGFHDVFILILLLLAVSVTVIAIAKLLKQPDSIALVLVGLVLGMTQLPVLEDAERYITQSEIFQATIISLFLPILLGDATLKLPFHHLFSQKKTVLGLAFLGTFISSLSIGAATYFLLDLPLAVAFTFAALMSATDPISVLSIFKSLGVKQKMSTIMEGESLFNDGIAVVLFKIASIYLLTYIEMGWIGLGNGVFLFLKFAVGGALIGLLLGYLFSQVIRVFDDYPLEVAFSALLFFGSYFIAEHFHTSGVIAVVVGGFVFGDYGAKIGMSKETKTNLNTFWDSVTLIANALIFLMVGMEIRNIDFAGNWGYIAGAIIIVIVGRTIAVYLGTGWVKEISSKERLLINWGGLRGSLSIALALSLPMDFDGRDQVLLLTFSVVLFSLIIQGLTLKPLIKKLKLA